MSLAFRSSALARARHFFDERGLLEVDPGALRSTPAIDTYIEPIRTSHGYLHTSPEYAMKILLSQGSGDIYFLGHVFRADEEGPHHSPEFTMAEWYRCGFSFEQMIEETLAFAGLFVGHHPVLGHKLGSGDPDEQLVDAEFDPSCFTIVTGFPPDRAANAQIIDGEVKRFEIYFGGLELANGYQELNDSAEQERRMIAANPELPLDRDYLDALATLPDCCGVAVGFDRLLMLQSSAAHISEVLIPRCRSCSGRL